MGGSKQGNHHMTGQVLFNIKRHRIRAVWDVNAFVRILFTASLKVFIVEHTPNRSQIQDARN